ITNTIPAGMSFVSATTGCYQLNSTTVLCPVGALASGASASDQITLAASASAINTTTVDHASVVAAQTDGTPANNSATASVAVGQAQPSIVGQASPSIQLGGQITDSATLSHGVSPTGHVTFSLYAPGDTSCSSPVATSTADVSANGTFKSDAAAPTVVG